MRLAEPLWRAWDQPRTITQPSDAENRFDSVKVRDDVVPGDLQVGRFLETMIAAVLDRTPIDMHVRVRELREHRDLPMNDVDSPQE